MARPVKNYCDYFPHDRDMRNHRKIKAIRTKYKIVGYGIWCMILEYLTGIDGNVFEYSDVEMELMAGDFGVSATEIRDVIDYCIKLELLFLKDDFIHSESLDERLKPVYDKRGVSKEKSKKQSRVDGKFSTNNTESNGVSVTEMPQSKVNGIKVNEITTSPNGDSDHFKKKVTPKTNDMSTAKDTEGIPLPFKGPAFASIWSEWLQYRKEARIKNYTPTGLRRVFAKLIRLSAGDESLAIEIVDQSLSNEWQGLFAIKQNFNGTHQRKPSEAGKTIEFDRP